MSYFLASFDFQDADQVREGGCKDVTLIYEAATSDATDSARRWWLLRQASVPEWFSRLLCVNIYDYRITPVDADGTCKTGIQPFYVYEWKCDTLGRGQGPLHFLTNSNDWIQQ